jgi:hypothetical protein
MNVLYYKMPFSSIEAKKQTEINKPIRIKKEEILKRESDLSMFNKCIKQIKCDSLNGYDESCCKNISREYENKLLSLNFKLVRAGVKHHDCLYITW